MAFPVANSQQPCSLVGLKKEALGCIRDRTGAKVIGTLSKIVGFPKLEADISSYRRQHIVSSLFYSNFKVKFFMMKQNFTFLFLMDKIC
jgi:hypothetical protein